MDSDLNVLKSCLKFKSAIQSYRNHNIKFITLKLSSNEIRFGFSVIGGFDEFLPAKIEAITPGSSADNADLQIGDEIMQINGKSVNELDHAQIISHIHNCIRERKIILKVKRSSKTNELKLNENIKEAYIIGVDEEAKIRLNNLTKEKKVTPIDIENISNQLNKLHQQQSSNTSIIKTTAAAVATTARGVRFYDYNNEDDNNNLDTNINTDSEEAVAVADAPQSSQSSSSSSLSSSQSPDHLHTTVYNDYFYYPDIDTIESGGGMVRQESALKQIKNKIISVGTTDSKKSRKSGSNSTASTSTPTTLIKNPIKAIIQTDDNDILCISASTTSASSSKSSSTKSNGNKIDKRINKISLIHPNDIELHTFESTFVHSTSSVISSTSSISSPTNTTATTHTNTYFNSMDHEELVTYGSREMAIDCPENFYGEVKTKPCFPPRQSLAPPDQGVFKQPFVLHEKRGSLDAGLATATSVAVEMSPMKFIDDQSQKSSFHQKKSVKAIIDKQKQNRDEDNLRRAKTNDEILLRNSLRNSEKLRKLVETKRNTVSDGGEQDGVVAGGGGAAGQVNNAFVNDESILDDEKNEQQDVEQDGTTTTDVAIDVQEQIQNEDESKEVNVEEKEIFRNIDISDLFSQIDYIQKKLETSTNTTTTEDITILRRLYETSEFQNALKLYNKIINTTFNANIQPVCENTFDLNKEILNQLEAELCCDDTAMPFHQDRNELSLLLNKLNFKQLLQVHDTVSLNYDSLKIQLPSKSQQSSEQSNDENTLLLSKAEHYCVENLKLVHIDKLEAPLGATIRNRDGSIVIGRIVKGGAADLSGLLHEDDEILEINSVPIRGKTINEVSDMLASIQGTVSFLIIPQIDTEHVNETARTRLIDIKHIRALYNYEPDEDLYIPCKELGLSFLKGDILHIISQEDQDWWQAYKDGDKDQTLAGLIPSQSFQEKRFSQMQALIGDSFVNRGKNRGGSKPLCYRGVHKKSKRRRMFESLNDPFVSEIVTYEEVVLYRPAVHQKRPIVLIGPHSIGRHELRKRLMQSNPSLYEVAVPHTTRTARRDEIDGKDYHFIARHIFEADIKQNRFVEHGEFEKNLYGTSKDAIKKVIENSKICVLNLYPQALKTLRNSGLMPYVIYIGPPSLSKLKELKINLNESYKENDLLDVIDKGREIEELYGHYFDKIIRNTDMDKTYYELVETIDKVQNEEQWIPAMWL